MRIRLSATIYANSISTHPQHKLNLHAAFKWEVGVTDFSASYRRNERSKAIVSKYIQNCFHTIIRLFSLKASPALLTVHLTKTNTTKQKKTTTPSMPANTI